MTTDREGTLITGLLNFVQDDFRHTQYGIKI